MVMSARAWLWLLIYPGQLGLSQTDILNYIGVSSDSTYGNICNCRTLHAPAFSALNDPGPHLSSQQRCRSLYQYTNFFFLPRIFFIQNTKYGNERHVYEAMTLKIHPRQT